MKYVAITPQRPGGFTIFSIVFLSIMCFIFIILILSLIYMVYAEIFRTVPIRSATERVEEIRLTTVESRTSFDSNPLDLEKAP